MGTPQERQQLHLGVVADGVVGAGNANAGFVELRQQTLDGYFQYLGKLANCDIRHRSSRSDQLSAQACPDAVSNQCLRAAMMSAPARSASTPSISNRSSTACSGRSSRVTMPRLASIDASSSSMPST